MRNVVEEKKGKRGEVKVWGQGSIYGICQRQIFYSSKLCSSFSFPLRDTYIYICSNMRRLYLPMHSG